MKGRIEMKNIIAYCLTGIVGLVIAIILKVHMRLLSDDQINELFTLYWLQMIIIVTPLYSALIGLIWRPHNESDEPIG